MRKIYLFFLFSFSIGLVNGQVLELLTPLSSEVSESSALIYLEGKLITLNDSGNSPNLFEIDSVSGNVTRTVSVVNTENVDWEALTYDDTYIYVGDFGNNNGNRTNLKVYRITRDDYFNNPDNEVAAETISFAYDDQTDFSSSPYNTAYDAEAMISMGDSLYIFTKNWVENTTFMYPLSKIPGEYLISESDSIGVSGWITDAAYNAQSHELFLLGYSTLNTFGMSIADFVPGTSLTANSTSYLLEVPTGYSIQLEGVTYLNSELLYFSSEGGFLGDSGLFKLAKSTTSINEIRVDTDFPLYPNPGSGHVFIRGSDLVRITIFDTNGRIVLSAKPGNVNISGLESGTYLVKAFGQNDELLRTAKFIVR